MKADNTKPTQPAPLPRGLEQRLAAAIDRWDAREKAARRRRRTLWAAATVAAAAVVAVAVLTVRPPEATAPTMARTQVAPPRPQAPAAQVAATAEPQATKQPQAAPAPVAFRPAAAKPQPAVTEQAPAEPSPQTMEAIEDVLAERQAERERRRQLIEDVLNNLEIIDQQTAYNK